MKGDKLLHCKLVLLTFCGIFCAVSFIASLCVNYQIVLTNEHMRFRKGMLSQANWLDSPSGTLSIYLFNITNAEAFLSGNETRIRLEEVGPIVYKVRGINEMLSQTDDIITYRKLRYHHVEFDPERSIYPDILNRTIVMPNLVLLGAAAKLHDWLSLVRHAFNAITINESVFLNKSVYYFLWDFHVPALSLLSSYVPNIVANCGFLHNALATTQEIYNVSVGGNDGYDRFFRINTFNNLTYFPQQKSRLDHPIDEYCPITVNNVYDNSIFPPFLQSDTKLDILAVEQCRTMRMIYDGSLEYDGYKAYRYVIGERYETPNCLSNSMGIKLPKGIYDVTKCVINDAPSAMSRPHFLYSEYNYTQHFEGILPNPERHEAHTIMEPTTGIPLDVKYRFQSNTPMPDMKGYSRDLQKLSNMVVPGFWLEFDLDYYPWLIRAPMYFIVNVVPILQPIMIVMFFLLAVFCFLKLYLIMKEKTFKEFFCKYYILIQEYRQRKSEKS